MLPEERIHRIYEQLNIKTNQKFSAEKNIIMVTKEDIKTDKETEMLQKMFGGVN